jgi:Flp pilus assembly protein TadG
MLTVLTGMAAIAIDGARAYALRRDMQAAVDSAALAAADKLQQSGSYPAAEQAATSNFANNLRLYAAPACTPYGTPGAAAWTVTCSFSDGTVLTEVAQGLGPRGGQFSMAATRQLVLQFARILTNGSIPTLAAASTGNVNNQRYTPAVAALAQAGCGGAAGTAISINGSGTLAVKGTVLANGVITDSAGALRVAGDIYARCQSIVPGATSACYPSGGSTPCTYPDLAGATRAGFRLADPGYPAPSNLGSSQGLPSAVVVPAGIYATSLSLAGGHCWFLSGGVYTFQFGTTNTGDFVSNELKPPSEPNVSNNTQTAPNQFWNTDGVNCAGGFQLAKQTGPKDIPTGNWAFVLTSTRTDVYNGTSYTRESAPSSCEQINLNNHFDNVLVEISNVPGATAYNIYAAPPGNGCAGPFGLAATLPVAGPVTNTSTGSCPAYTGGGCSLGNEALLLSTQLSSPFAPNAAAPPGTTGAYPPDPETAPLGSGFPNQNPPSGAGAAGDRANENNCQSIGGAYQSCPGPVTAGAVELNYPAGSCIVTSNGGDIYVFSGNQYNWVGVYEPPANGCANTLGAESNGAFIGLVYAPSATVNITSPFTFEAPGVGGVMANAVAFSGALPAITFSAAYAPVPPAGRLTS